ncbi:MAG: acyl-CoA dehydrogenase family protein [Steroidobacteraceae bacterium]|jgi:acyl-CoA dehydrogenase|nr:acyl-CoA dehydrogenase family protein [Steroidobacteraceae bacterium]
MTLRRSIFEAEHDIFRESAARFFREEIGPHSARWREAGQVDREAFLAAGRQGFLLMWADEAYGAAGIQDFRYDQILIEENARHGDICFYLPLHSRLVAPYIAHLGTPEQRSQFLPKCVSGETILAIAMTEPAAGSDLAGMKTRAEDRGDHWLLNGSKTYISNGIIADLVLVAARTVPEQKHGLGLFLVERGMTGFERGRRLKKIGLEAQDTAELFFNDVRVPKSHVLGDPTMGFRYLTQFLAEERLVNAVQYVANAQVAWDLTLEFVKSRRAFGRPIGAFQNTRFKLAELRAAIDALQVFVDWCVVEHNAGRLTPEIAAQAKLLTSELEGRTADECLQLHGGAGYMEEYRISRIFTDARISRIYAGTSEIMKEIIARGVGLDERKMT